MRKMSIKTVLKSKKAISPILATLLLIVIAVAAIVVTYAWITTFMGSAAQQAGFIPYKANVAFIDGTPKKISIDIGNSGTSNGQIVQVYVGTSASATQSLTTTPVVPILVAASSTPASFNVTYTWAAGTTYYFKVVPSSGAALSFTEQAPQ
jgi:flagellin-like protein